MSGCADIDAEPAGHHSFLSFEQSDSIIGLPILKYDQKRVTATSSWDSSIHDSLYLNRVTPNTERVYVILKVGVKLVANYVWNNNLIPASSFVLFEHQ